MIWRRSDFGQRYNEWIRRILLSIQIGGIIVRKIEKWWLQFNLSLKSDINKQLKHVIIVNIYE